jgi:hypothetical protein
MAVNTLVKYYIWNKALYRAETWKIRKMDHKYLESFEMWRWRRMEKISFIDRVKIKNYYTASLTKGISNN